MKAVVYHSRVDPKVRSNWKKSVLSRSNCEDTPAKSHLSTELVFVKVENDPEIDIKIMFFSASFLLKMSVI